MRSVEWFSKLVRDERTVVRIAIGVDVGWYGGRSRDKVRSEALFSLGRAKAKGFSLKRQLEGSNGDQSAARKVMRNRGKKKGSGCRVLQNGRVDGRPNKIAIKHKVLD
jgi:hypothetical protein